MSAVNFSPENISDDEDKRSLRSKVRNNFNFIQIAINGLQSWAQTQFTSIQDSIIKPALRGGFSVDDVRYYGTLANAVAAIPSGVAKTLFITDTQTIANNLTVPSNISIFVLKGGSFAISSGKTLTLNGPFESGAFQVFTGAGVVSFGAGLKIIPQWWGAKADGTTDDRAAIIAAQTAAAVIDTGIHFPPGTYLTSGSLTFNFTPRFEQGAILKWTAGGFDVQFNTIDAGAYQIFDFPIAHFPSFINQGTWFAKWFVSLNYACASLLSGYSLYLHNGDYFISSTIDMSNKSFISLVGESLRGVRLIPVGTPSVMLDFLNAEITTQREVFLRNLTFISSQSYGICNYAIRATWTPEIFLEECHFINVSKVYSVFFDTSFVGTFKNCVGAGRLSGTAGSQWGSPTIPTDAGGGGFYCQNTATTIKMDTCRWQYYEVGVTLNGIDAITFLNTAIESNTSIGLLINGSCTSVNIIGEYWEGQNASGVSDIRVEATVGSLNVQGNFFHGADISIRLDSSADIGAFGLRNNLFYSGNIAIEDNGAKLRYMLVEGNEFRDLGTTFAYTHHEQESERRMIWRNNYFPNSPSVVSDVRDMNGEDLTAWTPGSGCTITLDARKYLNDSVWLVTGSSYNTRALFAISATSNFILRSQWITVTIPILAGVSGANPEATLYDGINTRHFYLSASPTVWKQNVLYIQMDAAATAFTLSLTGAGNDIYVARPSARLGMYDEQHGGAQLTASLPSSGFANPSASIGLSAVNGTSTLAMRSDAAPALSQAITPTWTNVHTFSAQPVMSTLTASQAVLTDSGKGLVSVATTGSSSVVRATSPTLSGLIGGNLEWSGTQDFDARIGFAGNGTGASASLWRDATDGVSVRGIAGSANDLALRESSGTIIYRNPIGTNDSVMSGNAKLETVGSGFYIKEGTNAAMGVATLVLGVATVSTTKVTASSRIFLTPEALGTIASPVALAVTARSAGTSFTITSANLTDTSTVAWMIVEPA